MFPKALVSSNDSHGIEAYIGGGPAAVEGTQFYQGSVKNIVQNKYRTFLKYIVHLKNYNRNRTSKVSIQYIYKNIVHVEALSYSHGRFS